MSFGEKFDCLKIEKKDSFVDLSDLELVRLFQKDVDEYRRTCWWVCPSCGCRVRYLDSLLIRGNYYVHVMRCPQEEVKKRGTVFSLCKSNMNLYHPKGIHLDSVYFNELFARYQDTIIYESKKSWAIDSPDEIYSLLSVAFSKIVAQFARDKKFKSKTDKWFSSFFWSSIKNKIADLQKTKNYLKRTPAIKCMITGKTVGQITSRHLYKEAKEVIVGKIEERLGFRVLEESGEKIYYQGEKSKLILKRAQFLGKKIYNSYPEKRQKEIFNRECIEIYIKMFPGAIIKNHILSINHVITEGDGGNSSEIGDIIDSRSDVLSEEKNTRQDLEMKESIYKIVEITFNALAGNQDLFGKNLPDEKKEKIIAEVIKKKISYEKEGEVLDDVVIDMEVGIRMGATSRIINFIRENGDCRKIIGLSAKRRPKRVLKNKRR
jgi:hypothetical protein